MVRTAKNGSGKKNANAEWVARGKSVGHHILEDAAGEPVIDLFAPLPSIEDNLSKPMALLIRSILMRIQKIENPAKRRALAGLLVSLADSLDAMSLPDSKPYYVD